MAARVRFSLSALLALWVLLSGPVLAGMR